MNRPKFIKIGTAIAGLLLLIGCTPKDALTVPNGSWQVINPTDFVPPTAVMYQPKVTGIAPAPIQVLSTLPVPIAPSHKPVVVTATAPTASADQPSGINPVSSPMSYRMGVAVNSSSDLNSSLNNLPGMPALKSTDKTIDSANKGVSNATR